MDITLRGLQNAAGLVVRVRDGGAVEIDASAMSLFVAHTSDCSTSPTRHESNEFTTASTSPTNR